MQIILYPSSFIAGYAAASLSVCQPYHSILPCLVVHNYLIDAASIQVEPDPKVEETILEDTGM